MTRAGIDAIALAAGSNLFYLTGLHFHAGERLMLALIRADGRAGFVCPAMESPRVRASRPIPFTVHPWSDAEPSQAALQRCVDELQLNASSTIAVEGLLMRVYELRALEQAGLARFADAHATFSRLRVVKDADEIAAMREAARMIDMSLEALLKRIKPGLSERQIAGMWVTEMLATGAEGPSFDSIIASGPNAAFPHHATSDRIVQRGDLLILDGGARHQGYASDITRTVMLGEPSAEQRRIFDTVYAANAAGRAASQVGATGEGIDRAARAVIETAGFGPNFMHRTGHGLGLDVHEEPYIAPGQRTPLPIGSVFTIEPGVYVEGLGGVRVEDDVVLTQSGGVSLTQFPRELRVL